MKIVTFGQWLNVYQTSCCTILLAKGEDVRHYRYMHREEAKCNTLAFQIDHNLAVSRTTNTMLSQMRLPSAISGIRILRILIISALAAEEMLCTLF
jgi:hypothetical protein